MNTWLLPTSIDGTPFGDLPLAYIKKTVTQGLIGQMVAGGPSAKTISNYFQVVRMVFSACVDEDGQELYPRNWKKMGIILPKVNKKEQRVGLAQLLAVAGAKQEPRFAVTNESYQQFRHILWSVNLTLPVVGFEIIVNFASPCLFVDDDSGAVVENFLDADTQRLANSETTCATEDKQHSHLRLDLGRVRKVIHHLSGEARAILRRHLHPALRAVGFGKAGNHAFRRYRNTFLRNHTHCPESVRNFWLGWSEEGMSGLYDKIKADVAFRKEVAHALAPGSNVPATLGSIEPIEPKLESEVVGVNA